MTSYVGRHRAPKSTTTLTRVGTTAAAGAVALGMSIPAAGTASAAPATVAAPTVAKAKTASFTGIVKVGSRGATVKAVQRKVGATADGVFGPRTKAAVQRWQKRNGLVADGIVGPRTGTKMGLKRTAAAKKTTNRTTKVASRSGARTSGASIVQTAKSLTGSRYRYGGTTPSGFDCSGFTGYVYKKHGKNLPRTAEQQRRAATRVSNPQPGDLVFFGAPAHHVGIYAGNGQIIDAGSSGKRVSQRNIWTSRVSYGRF